MSASPVIIVTPKKPLSYNSQRKLRYQAFLANEAGASITTPMTGQLYSKAYYFYRGKSDIDADNLSKPILDAFKGVVFRDDAQVVLRVAAKISVETDTFELIQDGMPPALYQSLVDLIAVQQHILYIEVGALDGFRLNLGSERMEELSW